MKTLIASILKLLSCPFAVLGGLFLISVFSLAAALTAELVFGLEPCILCLYQRFPFALVALLSLVGLVLCKIKGRRSLAAARALIGLSGLAFLINSIIAFYHTGVEQKWWSSAVEGCAVPAFGGSGRQSMLDNILSAPNVPCDVIPWQDPILGLSMANYNVIMCFGLFVACALSVGLIKRRPSGSSQPEPSATGHCGT